MKYAIIIPDGAADDPLPELDGKTPLEAARTPAMDEIARLGELGTARTVPPGYEVGSDVATMSLLGYDPRTYHTGRAPLEAAAQAISLGSSDMVFRCNLVTVLDGVMKDHSAGGIGDGDARSLLAELAKGVQYPGFTFYPGVSYRNLLVYRGLQTFDLRTTPPHEIPEQPVADHLPRGIGCDVLLSIMKQSERMFDNIPINRERVAAGINPATQVWLWGQGKAPSLPKFIERFGVRSGCMITGVDLLRGIAAMLGWQNKSVAGMTSFHDTDYAAQGKATCDAIDDFDIVVSHIESPDEASHQADWKTKVAAIEAIDREVVAPVLTKLRTHADWRILVMPDHPSNIATRRHGPAAPLFAIAGSGVRASGAKAYSERDAARGEHLENGHELMSRFVG